MGEAAARVKVEGSKRDAILRAALELFAARGFYGTAVPSIAETAGVATGTIYRYFPSKEALVNLLYRHWKLELVDAVMNGFPVDTPIREQFHEIWARMIGFARANPTAFAFLELHHHAEYLDAESRSLETAALRPAFDLLEHTRATQITKDMPSEILINVVWGALVRLVRASWEARLDLTDEVANQAEHCCWEAIRR